MRTGPRAAVATLPGAPGVYRFRDARGRVLYIGRAAHLRRRVDSYWGTLGDRPHLARMVARIARVEAVVCDSEHEAAWLERNLLERSLPGWNRTPGGQEVPVFIRLDPRSGLRVVHAAGPPGSAGHVFGPYLGGFKVRLAVSALHRVLPLAYATDRLSGSERDMARILGVSPGDQHSLFTALAAVLGRDSAAVGSVRTELTRRRDAAAAELAFERAARLQSELAAVDWVVADQKAAQLEPSDVDVYGWVADLLVRFQMRAGRLCSWTQRSCTERAACSRLAATPIRWAEFARRNAELAARLAA